jgi:hypothetical protein
VGAFDGSLVVKGSFGRRILDKSAPANDCGAAVAGWQINGWKLTGPAGAAKNFIHPTSNGDDHIEQGVTSE